MDKQFDQAVGMRQVCGGLTFSLNSVTIEKRYQVFISSTFSDLQEERQEIIQALLELKSRRER